MSRVSVFSAPFLLGFDAFEERVDRLSKAAEGYPPYNIERSLDMAGDESFLISIAVAGFALLIFAVGLNLSGVFEVGSVTVGDSLAQRSGPFGAFFTGVLAVAVAAPCTAPFMAAALGFALTQSVTSAMLIFLGLVTYVPEISLWLPHVLGMN